MKFTLRFLKKFKNKILNPNVRNKEFDKIENIIAKILKEFEEKKKEAQLNIKTNL